MFYCVYRISRSSESVLVTLVSISPSAIIGRRSDTTLSNNLSIVFSRQLDRYDNGSFDGLLPIGMMVN